MNVTITFANKVESYYTRADGSAALSKDVLELNADGSAAVLWSRLEAYTSRWREKSPVHQW